MYYKTCPDCGAHLDPGELCDCRNQKREAAPLQRERPQGTITTASLADSGPNVKPPMHRFYFTYGSGGHPFAGGWTVVEAPSREAACQAFRIYHPDKISGILNCCDVYSEELFMHTEMAVSGNFGRFCHESITLQRELLNN